MELCPLIEENENEVCKLYEENEMNEPEEWDGGDVDSKKNDGLKVKISCPYISMMFESPEYAYSYYNAYARDRGFGTRKHTTRKSSRNGDVIGRRFCCSFEGFRQSSKQDEEKKRIVPESRSGCKSLMAIKKTNDGKWEVSQVVDEHNHALTTPRKTHNYRSHRYMSSSEAEVIQNMHSVGIRANLIMSFMAAEAGGYQNVRFKKKDVNYFLSSKRQKELANGDAAAVLEYFEKQQLDNPSFFHSIQVDKEGHMTNFFGADARSRIDYHHFGDVVCFDPTYLTNRYGMPFTPIISINHHYQTVIFGGALLFDETEESFAWVMSTWIRAMDGQKPRVIFTDQESAIGGAMSIVMPEAHHRYCIWHIMRNALKNIPHMFNQYKEFKNDFNRCLYGGETVDDFEVNWKNLLDKYNL